MKDAECGRGLSAATEPVGEAVSFPSESIRRIMCALALQTRNDEAVAWRMRARFGVVIERCDHDELERIGRDRLLSFWREELAVRPDLRALADRLLAIHTTPSTPPVTHARSSLSTFAASLIAEGKAIVRGSDAVGREESARRLAICRACPKISHARCTVCNCFVILKTKFRSQQCPLAKW